METFTKTLAPDTQFPPEDHEACAASRSRIVEVLRDAPEIYNLGSRRCAVISTSVLVKYEPDIDLYEAENMRLVASSTSFLIPQLLDAWTEPMDDANVIKFGKYDGETITYIVMQRIEAQTLLQCWPDLDQADRSRITHQVLDMIQQRQKVEHTIPGPIGGGKSTAGLFTEYEAGPYTSRKSIEDWFNGRIVVCQRHGKLLKTEPPFQFQRFVMCHMDLKMTNILIDANGDVWIIDWGSAGAYPPWFKKKSPRHCGGSNAFSKELLSMWEPHDLWAEDIAKLYSLGFALATGTGLNHPDIEGLGFDANLYEKVDTKGLAGEATESHRE